MHVMDNAVRIENRNNQCVVSF